MQTEMLTPSEKEQAREALQRAEIRADWIRTHLKAAGEGQVTENLEAELENLSREQFMLRTLLQPPGRTDRSSPDPGSPACDLRPVSIE
jgi:hypothetical protein